MSLIAAPKVFVTGFAGTGENVWNIDPELTTNPQAKLDIALGYAEGITPCVGWWMPQGAATNNTFGAPLSRVLNTTFGTHLDSVMPTLQARGYKLCLYTGTRLQNNGSGAPVLDDDNQAIGTEASSVAFRAEDAGWIMDNCLDRFGPFCHFCGFDALYSEAHVLVLDALRAAAKARGWFNGGIYGEAFPLDYVTPGVLLPNSINTTLAAQHGFIGFERKYVETRDPLETWRAPLGSAMEFWMDSYMGRRGPIDGRRFMRRAVERGFTLCINGKVPDWCLAEWRDIYRGANLRGKT